MHGALNAPHLARRAVFFIKENAEEADEPVKLETLKARIRSSGLPVFVYSSPAQLAEQVLAYFEESLEYDFPADSAPHPVELEHAQHDSFSEARTAVYVAEPALDAVLSQAAASAGSVLAVIGGSGSGKSALLAHWARQASQASQQALVITHFVGASQESTHWPKMLQRLMMIVKSEFNVAEDISTDHRELQRQFGEWLALVPDTHSVVFVLDGLDQLDDTVGGQDMDFLPLTLPAHVHFILSAQSQSTPHKALVERGVATVELKPFRAEQKSQLVSLFMGRYGKSLTGEQKQLIVESPNTEHPLYLRVVLEELRVHGVYETLTATLRSYLGAGTVPQLFGLLLRRLETDYGRPAVEGLLQLIAQSRFGLAEDELLTMLGISRLKFSQMFTSLKESLAVRDGLITFQHLELRKAVFAAYHNEASLAKHGEMLIKYFEKAPFERRSWELPYQLSKQNKLGELASVLCEMELFLALFNTQRKYELKHYWLKLGEGKRFNAAALYTAALRRFSGAELAHHQMKVARFLRELVIYTGEAQALLLAVLPLVKSLYGAEHSVVGKCCYLIAELYWNQAQLREAEPYAVESLRIREQALGPMHLHVALSLCGLAELWIEREPERARAMLERALQIRVFHFGEQHPLVARCYQDLSLIEDNAG